MEKDKKNIIAMLFGIILMLCSVVGLNFAFQPDQVSQAATNAYRNKVVIYDYFYGANSTSGHAIGSEGQKLWSHNYVVLKNVSAEEVDISDWSLFYLGGKSGKPGNDSYFKFPKNIKILPNQYIFVLINQTDLPVNVAETTFPQFVKDALTENEFIWNIKNGKSGGIILNTSNNLPNEVYTSLKYDTMVDLLSIGSCPSYLRNPEATKNDWLEPNEHIIRVDFTDDNLTNFQVDTNFSNSEADNSLAYLTGAPVAKITNIDEALTKEVDASVNIKGTITFIDNPLSDEKWVVTIQDASGAMKATLNPTYLDGGKATYDVGTVVFAKGVIANEGGENILTVDISTDNKNFAKKGLSNVYYKLLTLKEIAEVEDPNTLVNKPVLIKGLEYNRLESKLIDKDNNFIISIGVPTEVDGKFVNVKGILRKDADGFKIETNTTLVEEIENIAYGSINSLHTLHQESNTYKTVVVEGFITFADKAMGNKDPNDVLSKDIYIEDNNGGLRVRCWNELAEGLAVGQYIKTQVTIKFYKATKPVVGGKPDETVSGYSINATMDRNKIIPEAEIPQASTDNKPTITDITELDLATIRESHNNTAVSLPKATVTGLKFNKDNEFLGYTISFGTPGSEKEMQFSLGEENVLAKGDVINIKQGMLYTTDCWNVHLQSILDNDKYVITQTHDVAYTLQNAKHNDPVNVRGRVSYIDEANHIFYLESNGKGIKVTNAPAKMPKDFVQFEGVFKQETTDAIPTIEYSGVELPKRLDSTEIKLTPLTFPITKSAILANENQLVRFEAIRIAKIEGKTVTLSDNENTITLETVFDPTTEGFAVNEYINIEAVLIKTELGCKLISSDKYDITKIALSPISEAYTAKKGTALTVRGTVTFFETKTAKYGQESVEIISKMIIQDETHAITLYNNKNYRLEKSQIQLGCVVTTSGTTTIYKDLYEINDLEFIKVDSTPEFPQAEPVAAREVTIAEINANKDDKKNFQSLYVYFKNVTIDNVVVSYHKIFIKLTQTDPDGTVHTLDFRELACEKYFNDLSAAGQGLQDEEKLEYVMQYLADNNIFVGDSFNVKGVLDYYNNFVLIQNDNTDNNVIDYIDGIKGKEYTVNFYKFEQTPETLGQGLLTTITKSRNEEFILPTWNEADTPVGKKFAGWMWVLNNSNKLIPLDQLTMKMPVNNEGPTTIYATFEDLKYNVTFEANNDTTIDPIPNVIYGHTITLPTAPTKEGFTFAGWFTTEDFLEGTEFDPETEIQSDLKLYAKWNAIPKGPNVGLIIGIVAGVLVVLAGAAVGIVFAVRKNHKSKDGLSNMDNPEKEEKEDKE